MRRIVRPSMIAMAVVPLLGMSCEPPLVCGNPLDGGEFGFTLAVPAGIECDGSLPSPNEIILGFVTYRVAGTDTQIVVIAADAGNSEGIDVGGVSQGDCEDLGEYVNSNGVVFERCRFTSEQGVSYAGFVANASSNTRLLISIVAGTDDPTFGNLLVSLLEGVTLTG